MPTLTGYAGLGAQLQRGDGALPEVFTTIPGCGDITGPGKSRDTIETTSLDSTGGYRTFITGLRDGGEISCDMNWLGDDPTQLALETDFADNDATNYQLVFPFTPLHETFSFAGFVTKLDMAVPMNDKITRALTIKITGPVTQTNDAP